MASAKGGLAIIVLSLVVVSAKSVFSVVKGIISVVAIDTVVTAVEDIISVDAVAVSQRRVTGFGVKTPDRVLD